MRSAQWLREDLYEVLGVPGDSPPEEIKRAFRRLARTHHPDHNAGAPGAEQRFKEIAGAYTVLSDPRQRAQYDAMRFMAGPRHRPRNPRTSRNPRSSDHPRTSGQPRTPQRGRRTASGDLIGVWSQLWWSSTWGWAAPWWSSTTARAQAAGKP